MCCPFFSFLASTCRQEKHWHLFLSSGRAGDRSGVSTLSIRESSWDYHASYSAGSRKLQLLSYSANGTWVDLYPTSCSGVTHLYKQLAQRASCPNLCHIPTTHWMNSINHTALMSLGNKHLRCWLLTLDFSSNRLLDCFVPPALWWELDIRYFTVTVCLSHTVFWRT